MDFIKNAIFSLGIAFMLFIARGDLFAQQALIDVKIDSAAIMIGQQTRLHLSVTTAKDNPVKILIPADTLMNGVEILEVSMPDSALIENDKLVIKQELLLTSFDSALYLLPPIKVVDGIDTVSSNQVALKVSTLPVNVDKPEEFYDIKDVWKPPFVLADYYPLIFGLLFGLLLVFAIIYLVKRIKEKKSLLPTSVHIEPKLPPYEQAIKELDLIKEKKLWQQGLNKEYYTALTDTVRKYIAERFGVSAMEMTSSEILDELKKDKAVMSVFDKLKQILELADFVKFAKIHPLPDENDLSINNAYKFVNETKPEEIIADKENPDMLQETQQSNDNNESKVIK